MPRAYAAPSQPLFCAKQTLAGSLTARSPQRDSDVSDTVSSPRRRFDGVVTIFRRKVGVCDAGQAAGHRHMLRQASAWSPLFGQNVLRIVVVTVMVVMVVMGGGGGNGDGNAGDLFTVCRICFALPCSTLH